MKEIHVWKRKVGRKRKRERGTVYMTLCIEGRRYENG